MCPTDDSQPLVSSLHQELDALCKRLDQAADWLSDAETTMTAAAMAEEVERLCWKALLCDDPCESELLLSASRRRLQDLQILLGVH